MKVARIIPLLLLATLASAQERSQSGLDFEGVRPQISQPERAPRVMVASTHQLATQVGLDILRKGGNAVDAAVAVGFALAVVHPEAGNIGGGGYMVVRMADGRTRAFDYKESVPAAARMEAFPDSRRVPVGYRTAGVPGTVAGLEMAHRRFGRLKWSTLVEPARLLAARGFPASQRMELVLKLQVPVMKDFPETAKVFLHGSDKPLKQGEVVRMPELAATLGRISRSGSRDFYEGETAAMIAADMKAENGFITLDDLKSYRVIEGDPISTTYRGHKVLTMPPSSSGGFILLEMLNILSHFELTPGREGSVDAHHLMIEAMRRGFRDRLLWASDPKVAPVPLDRLLSPAWAAELARSIHPDGSITPASELPALPENSTGAVSPQEPPHTTHFSVVDGDGNMVANTYTLGSFYGSQVVIRRAGVLLGDMVGTIVAGEQSAARSGGAGRSRPKGNPLTPGARLVSTMSPTIILNTDGSPWVALGTPGGATIPSTLIQVVTNLIDYKMPLRDAIEFPRIHQQFAPDRIDAEPGAVIFDVGRRLTELGYTLNPRLRAQGDVHAVAIEAGTGMRQGWSDGRRGGHAAGY